MKRLYQTRKARIISAAVFLPIVAVFAFGIYLASLSGDLPWQVDPTRISNSLTPFAGIEGFNPPTRVPPEVSTPIPTPTP